MQNLLLNRFPANMIDIVNITRLSRLYIADNENAEWRSVSMEAEFKMTKIVCFRFFLNTHILIDINVQVCKFSR